MMPKRFITGSLLLGSALMLPHPVAVSVAQVPKSGAKEILTKVEEVYTTCRSYQDSGTVVSKNLAPDSNDAEETATFTTAFVRPGSFRFDYQYRGVDNKEHYLIWASGADVRTWWHRDPDREGRPESLSVALGAAAGVTHRASTMIPRLLRIDPDEEGRDRWTHGELKLLPDASDGDQQCARIQRTFRAVNFEDGSSFDVIEIYWIEKTTFLVRRLQIDTKDATSAFRTTLTYTPKINQDIPAKALELSPPAE